jgi:hypothetical protein
MAADAMIAAAAKSRRKKSRRGVFGLETTFRPAFIIGSIGSGAGSETTAFTDPIGQRETASPEDFSRVPRRRGSVTKCVSGERARVRTRARRSSTPARECLALAPPVPFHSTRCRWATPSATP